jgi:hypothetical protein
MTVAETFGLIFGRNPERSKRERELFAAVNRVKDLREELATKNEGAKGSSAATRIEDARKQSLSAIEELRGEKVG